MESINIEGEHTYQDVIHFIKQRIYEGKDNVEVLRIANEASKIQNPIQQDAYIFHQVYDLAVFRPSPEDRQQLRTVYNIVKEEEANCTGYTTIIGSILENLNKSYTLRIVDLDGTGFSHIYPKTRFSVMDEIITQKQDGTEEFHTRKAPLFNHELEYVKKIDFPMITTLNGRISANRVVNRNMNGFWDTLLTPLLGDEDKLQCNIAYANDEEARQECKLAADYGMTLLQYREWKESGGTTLSLPKALSPYGSPTGMSDDTKMILYVGGAVVVTYLLLNKRKR